MITSHFRFIGHGKIDQEQARQLAECSESAVENIRRFTVCQASVPVFDHHLFASSEDKGLLLQNTSQSHVDFEKMDISTVLDECFGNHFTGKENELVLRHILGRPSLPVLERGLAIYFTNGWQGKGYEYWVAKMALSGNTPPLTELIHDESWQEGGYLQAGCLWAGLVHFLIEKWGKEGFLKKYPGWQPDRAESMELEADWQQFLTEQAHFFAHTIETERQQLIPLPYLKGFNFAHEGYRIYNGYGSRQAIAALQKMKDMGADAAAIVPYSFMKNPTLAAPIPVVQFPGSENDESVIHSAAHAKGMGLKVILKPQIWTGHNTWTGDIRMENEKQWQAFFDYYSRWIVHYAMLAEIYHWDMLCIGNEMVQTTLEREQDWRKVIRQVRGIYNGPLVYAANWGDEFEKTMLWADLDYIGLNCYYPLSQKDRPGDHELVKGFSDVVQKVEKIWKRYQKPVIFTEIGFPSIQAPWKKPHEDRGDVIPESEDQRRCYEVVFSAIQGKPWCQGILWWKFPSSLEGRRRSETDFSPLGKPAEKVVSQWFRRE